MAMIEVTVTRSLDWPADAELRLYRGDEHAPSIAASSPAGGWGVSGTSWGAGPEWVLLGQTQAWGSGTWGLGAWGYAFAAGGTLADTHPAWPSGTEIGGWGSNAWGDGTSWTLLGQAMAWADPASDWGGGAWGISMPAADVFRYRYRPTSGGKSAQLPVGVRVADAAGNESAVTETLVQLDDAPIGARDLAVAATATPNEAALTWTQSPDIS